MRSNLLLRSGGALALAIASPLAAHALPSVFPTGVTIYDPARAYNGYVLFGGTDGKTHLIDMDGNEVHQWAKAGFPAKLLDPSLTGGALGHVLVQFENGPGVWGGIFNNKSIAEEDWQGKTLWSWGAQAPGGAARENHDWARLPNGDTLLITTADHIIPQFSAKPIADQVIREVSPQGKIVWNWVVSDHLNEFGFSAEGLAQLHRYLAPGNVGMGFLTINDMAPIGPNHWFDAGDKRFDPANIVIDSRDASFIAIIDHTTGHIVWRLGPDYPASRQADLRPTFSEQVPRPVDQTSGQHDAHIIEAGLPGAGNLLVFDNEGASGYPPTRLSMFAGSRVLEINPVTKQIVWQYDGLDSNRAYWSFFSSFISSARRLPNGNTLIDEGMNGRMFQVTPKGDIVWEYVSPYFGSQAMGQGRTVVTNWVYRAQPVPYDWVPAGTPHQQHGVKAPDLASFRVPGG